MKFWVARHAYAGPPSSDPQKERERPLQPIGVRMAKALASALAGLYPIPYIILSSSHGRAIQTADIVGARLKVNVDSLDELNPRMPMQAVVEKLLVAYHVKRVMVVAHVDNTGPCFNAMGGDMADCWRKGDPKGDDWPDLVMGEVRYLFIDRQKKSWKCNWRWIPSDAGITMPTGAFAGTTGAGNAMRG